MPVCAFAVSYATLIYVVSLRTKVWLILALTIVTALITWPRESDLFKAVGLKNVNLEIEQGLDLQGGAHLVFKADQAELDKLSQEDREKAMTGLIDVIQKRANPAGTSEITVQRQGSDRVIVELPGVQNVGEAVDKIGRTAQLTFLEIDASTQQPTETGITGKDIEKAEVGFSESNQPVVSLQMKGPATKKFGELTTRLNKTNGQLITLLDDQPIFGPAGVSSPIVDGRAQLEGNFGSIAEARTVADQITAGALPIPVTLVEERTVGPTLGRESIAKSIVAGIIGLAVVAVFMALYYRLAGVFAVGALIIYTLLTLTIYKLSGLTPYSIVLTLAGTAGFILSIGMAVDANILVFERMKEELRSGKNYATALESAFDRAWTSIRDSNVATIITCVILYFFSGTALIKGFAVTLGLGVLISMFTAIVVSRTMLRLSLRYSWGRKPEFYGVKASEVKQ